MVVAAKPYFVPDRYNWKENEGGSVAIMSGGGPEAPPLLLKARGRGFVAVEWGVTIIGVYAPPAGRPPDSRGCWRRWAIL